MESTLDPVLRRIRTASGSRVVALVGCAVAAVCGLFVYLLASGGAVTVGDRPGRPGDAWFPALLGLAGLALAGYRSRTEIDVAARSRQTRRRFWLYAWERQEPLGEPQRITLGCERRGGSKNSRIVYPVQLVTDRDTTEIEASGNERRARRTAEAAAKLCGVALHDERAGHVLVRPPDRLDQALVDAVDPAEIEVSPPGRCRVSVLDTPDRTTLRVPAPLWWLLPLGMAGASIPAGLILPHLVQNVDRLEPILRLAIGTVFVLVPFILLGLAARAGGLVPARVEIDREGLRVGRRSIPRAALEEAHVCDASAFVRHLRLESDDVTVRLGRGLELAELEYLRAAILRALRARQ